jgi:hypothetical protein
MKYEIIKTYDGFPSKTKLVSSNLDIDEAFSIINWNALQWHRAGGIIVDQSDLYCILEESDGSNIITYKIEKMEVWHGQ